MGLYYHISCCWILAQVQLKFDKNSDFISDYNFALAKSDLELAADLVFAFVKFSAIQKGQSEAASNFLAAVRNYLR